MSRVELDPAVESRIMTAANFQEPDRVPIWEFLDNRAVLEYFAPGETDLLTANVKAYHGLGIDLCRGYGSSYAKEEDGTLHPASPGGVDVLISGQTAWKKQWLIRSVEQLRAYQPWQATREWVYDHWLPQVRRAQEAFAPYTMYVPGHGCGFHATYDLMGLEFFSYAVYDHFDEVQRILDVNMRNAVMVAEACAEQKLCPLYFTGDDIAYKNKLLFSPSLLRRTFIPMLAACCRPLKEAGIKVIYHSDGYLMPIIDDLIAIGVDGINPIEPIAGMDIGVLKKKYYGRLILVGGLDCSQILPLGSVKEVEQAVINILRTAGPGGGLFIGSSSEVTPSTPLENVLAYCRTVHERGRYPIQ